MFANRYTVLIDACSLVGVWKRNILLSLADAELFRLRWSQEILIETERAIASILSRRNYSEADAKAHAKKSISIMKIAFPEADVDGYEAYLKFTNELPDPNDKHVLAAALKTRASMLVTENLKDFPSLIVEPLNIEVKTADEFISDAIELDIALSIVALKEMRKRFENPKLTPDEMLTKMESVGLTISASTLRPYREIL